MEQSVVAEQQQRGNVSLTLQVMNGNELESGRAARCLFSGDGGEIGHSEGCHWPVQDRAGSIAGRACAIVSHDGAFCLRSLMPGLMINLAPVSTDAGLVCLRQGDEISLGALALKVFLHEGKRVSYGEQMATPESIVTQRDSLVEALISTDGQPEYPGMQQRHHLTSTVVNSFSSDPLQVLQSESLTTAPQNIAYGQRTVPLSDQKANGGIDMSFMDLPPVYADPRDDEFATAEMAQKHLAVTPLLRGLGSTLSVQNSQDADAFLEETGRALQAAIQGLLDLQHSQNCLSDKHLRPLEDNPLRLSLDYATALEVMFAEGKSPVHLAAPAAIRESLRNVRHHEEANRAAIDEALHVMLDAFSPQSLMRRFIQYRRSHELRRELDDAGAWGMYRHYYDELASDRQQGFSMLFNEVYAQVYDRVLREKQQEPYV
ncbi:MULTISPECIES: type VI secretion system-associated FHA domain protein TagH [Citrobacter]|jgi:type VI secretion system protein ImpI|uniref:type VI secretion system-associated FHA domain protein TagH n=1 Tax=Citrobacter sp. TBCS-14 TaxID=2576409 RepID=UPI0010935B1E|nr:MULTISPECIES: type VI secretion system-associated FHA domain protein TagH [Citrobacter]QCA17021.1 type VI secretion system-associated FHA domain protein TagH [Citrobacter freundii]QLZ58420.1 type VI secretion system-associated FHA domain protein TagH [Citrobacter freundii]QMJ04996.1 type VI secretion system-associated FHA domain protein TagH [Citrobacter freundii]QMJ14061.1 type VI secretion system-associated FHA domain protein TagH [Citrobacter freundii]TKU87525.1 type VI secretion system-